MEENKGKEDEHAKKDTDVEKFKEIVTFVLQTLHTYSFSMWTLNKIPGTFVLGAIACVGLYVAVTHTNSSNNELKEMLLHQTRVLERIKLVLAGPE